MGQKNILITENQLTDLISSYFPNSTSVKKFVNFLKNIDIPFIGDSDKATADKNLAAKLGGTTRKSSSVNVKTFSDEKAKLLPDLEYYKDLLVKLRAPVSDDNLKFLYAWRQAEGAGGRNNPFNTTLKTKNSTFFNFLNPQKTMGVQNYRTKEEGFDATLKTLKLKSYACIVDGLRENVGAKRIANECRDSLRTWGTGDLVNKVLKSYDRDEPIKVRAV